MKPKIIFDTDIGCDCDDAGALALALELMNAGECELLAVTHCTGCEAAAGCLEAILRYYGHPGIPVGSFCADDHVVSGEWHDVYATEVAMGYETRFRRGENYENTVKLLRRTLAEAEEKVRLVATGPLSSLERLLLSEADEYSGLSGTELVRQKVEFAVCMAGRFPGRWTDASGAAQEDSAGAEWNVACDITAAQTVCRLWPTRLILSSFETGARLITCGGLQTRGPRNNPVRTCYEVWSRKGGNGSVGRESWDAVTMLHAIRPEGGYWGLHPFGKIQVADDGQTIWQQERGGQHSFLVEKLAPAEVETVIDEILERDISRGENEA